MGLNAQQSYNSAGMPVGCRKVKIYRITSPPGPGGIAPAFGAGSTPSGATLLGTYILEIFGWKSGTKEIERMDEVGADLDFALLRQKVTGSFTAELSQGTTPILVGGTDFIEISPGYETDGATPMPLMRLVITEASKDENEGAAQKVTGSLRLDRQNSDPFWQS